MDPAALLDDTLVARLSASWGLRLGTPVPQLATDLVRAVLLGVAADAPPGHDLHAAAGALGVLRARTCSDVTGPAALVADLLALRPAVEAVGAEGPRVGQALEAALGTAAAAWAAERVARPEGTGTRDPLTDLLSRPVLEEALVHEVASATRYGAPSLLLLDLDGLTRCIAVQGHLAADLHVVRATELLRGASRRSDVLARIGLDQFALLLPRTDLTRAMVVARRVLARGQAEARAHEELEPGTADSSPRLSIGLGHLTVPGSATELFEAAEEGLSRARALGGRTVETNPVPAPRAAAGAVSSPVSGVVLGAR